MLKFLKSHVEFVRLWTSCVRASKRAHDVYKAIRLPLHGAYFCLAALESHGLLVIVSAGLLALLVIGVVIEERL